MTSKFQTPRIRFKTPAVCKKSPPGPELTAFPAALMTSFFQWRGTDNAGVDVDTNEQFNMTYDNPGFDRWQTSVNVPQGQWQIQLLFFPAFDQWTFNALLFRDSILRASGQLSAWTPRQLDPYDSNYLQLLVPIGVGTSSTRVLL